MTQDTNRLDGWGEITAYLKCDRKTVLSRGYPIRYHRNGKRPCVYALRQELDSFDATGALFPTHSHTFPNSPIANTAR